MRHSGYFDELATKIGPYPNLIEEEDVEVPGGLANFRNVEGICDDMEVMQKWEDLLDASMKENGRLSPSRIISWSASEHVSIHTIDRGFALPRHI